MKNNNKRRSNRGKSGTARRGLLVSCSSSSSSWPSLILALSCGILTWSSSSFLWIRPVQGAFTAVPTSTTTTTTTAIHNFATTGTSGVGVPKSTGSGSILFQNSKYSPLASPYRTSSSSSKSNSYYSRGKNLLQLLAVPPPSSQEPSFFASSSKNNENINHHHDKDDDVLSLLVDSTTTTMNVQSNKQISSWTKSIRTAWSQSQKSAMTFLAAALIMASVLLTPFQDAMAAPSGGRMGGSFGSGGGSNRQSYSSGRSSTYRSPQGSSSSSSYTRGFTQGYGTGYLSRPSVTVVPSIGGYGYGYGGYFGAPIVSPGLTVVSRGPSIVDVLIFGFFATVLFRTFTSSSVMMDDDDTTMTRMSSSSSSLLGSGVTVAQISVAVRVPNRKDPSNILSFLERLSRTARTDSRVGISNLVSQVALELLRQKRFIFAADTEYKHFSRGNENGAQRHYTSKTIQERSKFEKESTSKYGGVDYSSSSFDDDDDTFGKRSSFVLEDGRGTSSSSILPQATNAVVTLIISIDGDSTKLPQINNVSDLEKALTRIATDVKVDDCLRSAEVLWTPDDKRDVLSDRDIYVDYPKLRNV